MYYELPEGAGFTDTDLPTNTEVWYVNYWPYDEAAKNFTSHTQYKFDDLADHW